MAAINSNFHRAVVSPYTGQEYLIRKLAIRDFYRDIGVMPIGIPQGLSQDLKALTDSVRSELEKRVDDKEFEQQLVKYVLEKGVITPAVWFLERERCPETAVAVEDIGDDYHWLVDQVIEFTFNLAVTKDLDKFFRNERTGDPGLGGEEVRH